MNKSILALTVAASFAAFAPSAQAGSWYGSYYGHGGSSYSSRTWCVNEDGEYFRCRRVYKDSALPSIPGLPGSVQRKMENLLGISGGGGCRRWSNWRQAWVRTSCD
jgi:hypothetical protein